jgi:Spy/CpxP family protein refolding chaperone
MMKWTLALAAALAVGLVAVAQAARPGGGGDLHGRVGRLLHGQAAEREGIEEHLDAAAALLGLSEAQRKAVGGHLAAALPGFETRAQALLEAHAEQLKLVHARELDEEALRAASRRAGAAQGELAVAAARLLRDVHGVLTPEQRAKLGELHRGDLQGCVAEHVREVGRGARAWAERQ